MKLFSSVPLAAMLLAGVAAVPAGAAPPRKEQAESPTVFILSKEFRESALAAETALKANDLAAAETAVAAAEGRASNASERYVAKTLRVKLMIASPQTSLGLAALIEPLDQLIADPRTPKQDAARYLYVRGDIAYAKKKYADAINFYRQARDHGLQDQELDLQLVRANMDAGDVVAGAAALDALIKAEVAAGRKPPESWYLFPIPRLTAAKQTAAATAWTSKWLAAYGTRANWHDAIALNGFKDEDESKMSVAEKRSRNRQFVDLFRLMRATHSLAGEKDYVGYARRANALGLNDETRSVIQEGRAAGAIPAKDTEMDKLLAQATRGVATDKVMTARAAEAAKSKTGTAAADLGDAYLGRGDYAQAVAMYDLALEKSDDDSQSVHMHRGIAHALAGDKDAARADFAAITQAPATAAAALWLIWLDSPPAS